MGILNQDVTQEVIRLTWRNPAFMAIAIALIWLIPQLLIRRILSENYEKKKLEKQGESPEKDLEKLRAKAKKKRLEKVVKTTEDPKFKRLDIRKGLTEAQKKALRKKQGGMAMKKKGMAKGGMKKKGYAKGGMTVGQLRAAAKAKGYKIMKG